MSFPIVIDSCGCQKKIGQFLTFYRKEIRIPLVLIDHQMLFYLPSRFSNAILCCKLAPSIGPVVPSYKKRINGRPRDRVYIIQLLCE